MSIYSHADGHTHADIGHSTPDRQTQNLGGLGLHSGPTT